MKISAGILFLCLPGCLFSQTVHTPLAFPYVGLEAYSNTDVDVLSFEHNQASLARIKNVSVGVYGEKRFLLTELGWYNASAALPTSSGNFGLNAGYFGFSAYMESSLGLAYARSLGSRADVGVQFNYYSVRIAGYGSASTINFEAGAIFHLTSKLNAGIHAYNPVAGSLGKDNTEKLASIYSAGIGYEASKKFFAALEVEKEENRPVNINAGVQYKFLPQILARAGLSASTSTMYFGIGFEWNAARLDVTTSYQPQLGITPGLLLLYNFNKK